MKKLCLIMADFDVAYIESVSAYVRVSRQRDEFDLKLFSTPESLVHFLESGSSYDILLISKAFLPSLKEKHRKSVILLMEEDDSHHLEADVTSVFKFQPLDQLLTSVVSNYRSKNEGISPQEKSESRTKILSVYSASGGSGKTTLATNLCKQLSRENQKVFYLNLELSHSTPLFFSSQDPQHSSQILYYVKANPQQVRTKIESLKKFDPYAKVDFFDFMVNPEEMEDMTGQETEILISAIIESEIYDALVIDLDSSFHERIKTVLQRSHQIFWLVNHDLTSFHKNAAMAIVCEGLFGKDSSFTSKITFVINKYTGSLSPELTSYDLSAKHFLPYIPEWKSVNSMPHVATAPIYLEAVNTLIKQAFPLKSGAVID